MAIFSLTKPVQIIDLVLGVTTVNNVRILYFLLPPVASSLPPGQIGSCRAKTMFFGGMEKRANLSKNGNRI